MYRTYASAIPPLQHVDFTFFGGGGGYLRLTLAVSKTAGFIECAHIFGLR